MIAGSIHHGQGLRFPCNERIDKANKLFNIWPFHYGPEPVINNKTNNWSVDKFKKTCHLKELYTTAHNTARWHWLADTLFDSCQLTITLKSIWMSNIKLNTARICLWHMLAHYKKIIPSHYKKTANQSMHTNCSYRVKHVDTVDSSLMETS